MMLCSDPSQILSCETLTSLELPACVAAGCLCSPEAARMDHIGSGAIRATGTAADARQIALSHNMAEKPIRGDYQDVKGLAGLKYAFVKSERVANAHTNQQ